MLLESTIFLKVLSEFGTTVALIAFVLWSGDRREQRMNETINKTLGEFRVTLERLVEEAIKGNELTRQSLARLDGTKEITR